MCFPTVSTDTAAAALAGTNPVSPHPRNQHLNVCTSPVPFAVPRTYLSTLRKVKETVAASLDKTGAEKALLVGHSAGGWLARAALAEGAWEKGVASEHVVAGEAI